MHALATRAITTATTAPPRAASDRPKLWGMVVAASVSGLVTVLSAWVLSGESSQLHDGRARPSYVEAVAPEELLSEALDEARAGRTAAALDLWELADAQFTGAAVPNADKLTLADYSRRLAKTSITDATLSFDSLTRLYTVAVRARRNYEEFTGYSWAEAECEELIADIRQRMSTAP